MFYTSGMRFGPYNLAKRITVGTVDKIGSRMKCLPGKSVGYYQLSWTGIGATVGTVGGIVSGVALPAYVGWKLGDYLSDKMDFPGVVRVGTDIVSACFTTGVCAGVSIPVLAIAGAAAGALTGLVAGTVVGVGKKSIDTVLRR